MKRNFIYMMALGLTAGLSCVSCSDLDEDVKGAVTSDSFYADELSINSGVNGIYGSAIRGYWGDNMLFFYTGADDLTSRLGSNKSGYLEGDQFNWSGGNNQIPKVYNEFYQGILNSNDFLDKVDPSILPEAQMNNYLANARFVRALLYMQMAFNFEMLPMPLTSKVDAKMYSTSSRDVLEQCLKDFEFVSQWAVNDRDTDPTVADGHATKTAAKAYLAKIYMQLTGYPYNETDKWTQVYNLTKEIVDGGVYNLVDDYAACFERPTQNNREMVYAHMFSWQPWPIGTECRWYGNAFTQWCDMYMEQYFYDNMPADYRRGFSITNDPNNKFVKTHKHPIITKYLYGAVPGQEGYENKMRTSNNLPAMRFSEVLLMYAEACVHQGDKSTAIESLNRVRRRAHAMGATTQEEVKALAPNFWMSPDATFDYSAADFASDEALIDAICNERGWEFVAEIGGAHWLDLKRREKVGQANENRAATDTPFIGDPYDSKNWWTPLPASETTLNPNLNSLAPTNAE